MRYLIVVLVVVTAAFATEVTHSSFDIVGYCAAYEIYSFFYPDSIPQNQRFIEYVDIWFGESPSSVVIRIYKANSSRRPDLLIGSYINLDPESYYLNHIVFEDPVLLENGYFPYGFCIVLKCDGADTEVGFSDEDTSFSGHRGAGTQDPWYTLDGEFAIAVGFCGNPAAFEPDTWAGIKSSF